MLFVTFINLSTFYRASAWEDRKCKYGKLK